MPAAHVPTPETTELASKLAGWCLTQTQIADALGIDPKTLRLHYGEVMAKARANALGEVAAAMFRRALGDGSGAVTAGIFILKTQADWVEKSKVELQQTAVAEAEEEKIDLTLLTDSALQELSDAYHGISSRDKQKEGQNGKQSRY